MMERNRSYKLTVELEEGTGAEVDEDVFVEEAGMLMTIFVIFPYFPNMDSLTSSSSTASSRTIPTMYTRFRWMIRMLCIRFLVCRGVGNCTTYIVTSGVQGVTFSPRRVVSAVSITPMLFDFAAFLSTFPSSLVLLADCTSRNYSEHKTYFPDILDGNLDSDYLFL